MEELYQLNDKQLREKCLQYGLPNVPVTDSSRKILIRKLYSAMTGNSSSGGSKATKTKSSKTVSPTNRRKTVAATITTTISSGEEDDFNITTNRSTTTKRRQTFVPSPASKPYSQRIIPMEIESRASSTRIGETNTIEPRQRRSVSLSKTGILTTSYSQETVPLRSTYEQQDEDSYEEDQIDDVEMDSLPDTRPSTNYNQTNYTQNNYSNPNYNTTTYANLTMPPPVEPSVPKLYPNLNSPDLQTGYYNSLNDIRASHSSTVNQNRLGFTYNPPMSYIPPPQTPPKPSIVSDTRKTFGGSSYSSGLANSPTISTAKTDRYNLGGSIKRQTARTIDDEGGASSSDDQYDTPYLSKFSRNLDNFKSEPAVKRTTTSYMAKTSPTVGSRYSSYSPMAPKRRRATYENENGITIAQFWGALEQKYHLKQAFFFILCFVAAVFIYVFFLQ